MRFRCIFLRNFLTKNSPCWSKKGILIQILGLVSSEKPFWDGRSLVLCLLQNALDLAYLAFNLRIIENRTFAWKPFQGINLEIVEIYLLIKVKLLHIFTARWKGGLTHAILRDKMRGFLCVWWPCSSRKRLWKSCLGSFFKWQNTRLSHPVLTTLNKSSVFNHCLNIFLIRTKNHF